MPEPNRLPHHIEEELARLTVGDLIEQRAQVHIECDACHHTAVWSAEDLGRKFPRHHAVTFGQIGPHLRCGVRRCRSDWVRVSRLYQQPASTPTSPTQRELEFHDEACRGLPEPAA
jgi:hypothetical protein